MASCAFASISWPPLTVGGAFTVLSFGTLSVLFGAFYALTERDLKKLLAYSSVENLGIILMGVGVGMLGLYLQSPVLAVLGFLAALYHMLNHAFFKGLLLLGAESAVQQTDTHDLNHMGGLNRRMPWTALTFLIAALAVMAVPPLNGFVSEWFTYQALLKAAGTGLFALRVFAPLFAVLLALAGGLAVMVYLKAYGGAVDRAVHREDGLGPAGAAVGGVRRLVRDDGLDVHPQDAVRWGPTRWATVLYGRTMPQTL